MFGINFDNFDPKNLNFPMNAPEALQDATKRGQKLLEHRTKEEIISASKLIEYRFIGFFDEYLGEVATKTPKTP